MSISTRPKNYNKHRDRTNRLGILRNYYGTETIHYKIGRKFFRYFKHGEA